MLKYEFDSGMPGCFYDAENDLVLFPKSREELSSWKWYVDGFSPIKLAYCKETGDYRYVGRKHIRRIQCLG